MLWKCHSWSTVAPPEGGRECPSVPRVPQNPVTWRNKVSASLLRCGIGVRYLGPEPHPACAELQPDPHFSCCLHGGSEQGLWANAWSCPRVGADTAGRCRLNAQSNGLPSLRWEVGGLGWLRSCSPQEGEEGLCAQPGCSALEAALTDKSQVRGKNSQKVGGNKTGAASGVQQRHVRRPCPDQPGPGRARTGAEPPGKGSRWLRFTPASAALAEQTEIQSRGRL